VKAGDGCSAACTKEVLPAPPAGGLPPPPPAGVPPPPPPPGPGGQPVQNPPAPPPQEVVPVCGNGKVEKGEACDLGQNNGPVTCGGGCTKECTTIQVDCVPPETTKTKPIAPQEAAPGGNGCSLIRH
jgi:hypothetical protein